MDVKYVKIKILLQDTCRRLQCIYIYLGPLVNQVKVAFNCIYGLYFIAEMI